MMRLLVTRDSVCLADDIDVPHASTRKAADGASLEALIRTAWGHRWWQLTEWVPAISGGRATWVIESAVPLAVAAQEWRRPRLLPACANDPDTLLRREGGAVRFHLRYLAQADPDATYDALSRKVSA